MAAEIKLNIDALYDRHLNGESLSKIAQSIGIHRCTLERKFKKYNLDILYKRDIYNTKSQNIIDLYTSGFTCDQISKKLNIPTTGIWRLIKENNIQTRSIFDYREKLRKYTIDNESYFKNIDTEIKAYILGFLYADGSAHNKCYHIRLKLQEKDKQILERIKQEIGINNKLHFLKKQKETHQNQYSLIISNKVMYYDLIKHGVVPNKTFVLEFPEWLPDNLIHHFVRGYFDGDGSIYISNKNSPEWLVIGTSSFCLTLQQILHNDVGIQKSSIQHDVRCSIGIDRLRIRARKDIIKIYKWMYQDSTIQLDRKLDKFAKIKGINDNV